ncbi:hypothetical protein BLOT_012087 [Blomia tropicalis]|nr:hypothetical protein BLOT_012087 [Blomia tropicalis]
MGYTPNNTFIIVAERMGDLHVHTTKEYTTMLQLFNRIGVHDDDDDDDEDCRVDKSNDRCHFIIA